MSRRHRKVIGDLVMPSIRHIDTVNLPTAVDLRIRFCIVVTSNHSRRRRGGGQGARVPPPPPKKKSDKYFSGNYYVKCRHFSGKNHAKFGNLVFGQIC